VAVLLPRLSTWIVISLIVTCEARDQVDVMIESLRQFPYAREFSGVLRAIQVFASSSLIHSSLYHVRALGFKWLFQLSFWSSWDHSRVPPHLAKNFVLLLQTGFHHVGWDGLDLLTWWSTLPGLQKCWDNSCEPPRPGFIYGFTYCLIYLFT